MESVTAGDAPAALKSEETAAAGEFCAHASIFMFTSLVSITICRVPTSQGKLEKSGI